MFQDQRVVITGGSSGAGKALARALLLRGARVALLARDPAKLDRARSELPDPARVIAVPCDVSDAESVTRAFSAVRAALGPATLLVNSAGILAEGRFESTPPEVYRRLFEVNFFGTLHASRAALAHFVEADGGRIVNIASVAGLMGVYGYAPYCSTKHALVGLSETMRVELAPTGVRVHLVCPPEFESPMVDELETYRSRENRAMVRSLGVLSVTEVAEQILHGIEKDRFLIVPGRNARVATTLARWFPDLSRRMVDRMLERARRP